MKASRGSSRSSTAAITSPSGSTVGISFMEWTARSTVRGEQRLLDLLGKKSLAARLGQRPVEDAVATRPDDDDLDRVIVKTVGLAQQAAHEMGLSQR